VMSAGIFKTAIADFSRRKETAMFDQMQQEYEATLGQAMRDRRINIGQDADYMRQFIDAKRAGNLARSHQLLVLVRTRHGKTQVV
jgi:hypothetical protein